jgi:alpha-D-ribose 1-methylphosphonate 5-triphosphate synthase subunit PhnH
MAIPKMTDSEARQRLAFIALMWALSHPGRTQTLPYAGRQAFELIAETLVDLETGFFSPDPELSAAIRRTGGRSLPPVRAPYQFYPQLGAAELDLLAEAPVGSYLEPDSAATLVIGCTLTTGTDYTLRGPGIADSATLTVSDLPESFWQVRRSAGSYPLGWDIFLVDGVRVIGLPRTTVVEVG